MEPFFADIIPITQEGKQIQRKVNWIALLQHVSIGAGTTIWEWSFPSQYFNLI